MKNKKTIFITVGSIALVIALFVGSYVIRQNQFQSTLPISAMMNNEDTGLTTAEFGTMAENKTEDEIGNSSELSAEPPAKLDKIYEEAMADSDLEAFEIELIRLIVGKENKTFEEALQTVRPGSKVVYEQTETQTASNNQEPSTAPTPTPMQPTDNDNNTQKPPTPNANNVQSFEERYDALNSQSFEKKRAALFAGIEELKVQFPGYDNEWDIVAKEFYTDEEIRTENPLDQLCVLEMYAEDRGGKPPMKYIHEYEICEWKHMPTFTANMSEHDPENCCRCTSELAGEGEHELQYSEQWSVL